MDHELLLPELKTSDPALNKQLTPRDAKRKHTPVHLGAGSVTTKVQQKQKIKRSKGEKKRTRVQMEDDEGAEAGRFQKPRTISSNGNKGKEVTATHQHPPALQEQVVSALQSVLGQRPGDVMIQKLEVHIHVDNKN